MEEDSKVKLAAQTATDVLKGILGERVFLSGGELFQKRLKICMGCEFFKKPALVCSKCGCMMKYKAKLIKAKCPIGLW